MRLFCSIFFPVIFRHLATNYYKWPGARHLEPLEGTASVAWSPCTQGGFGQLRVVSPKSGSHLFISWSAAGFGCASMIRKDGKSSSFQIIAKIGEGTYGKVFKGVLEGKFVAVKFFKSSISIEGISLSTVRELCLLKELQHPNIISLVEVDTDYDSSNVILIFEYATFDLFQMLRAYGQSRKRYPVILTTWLPLSVSKTLLWQILKGIEFLHRNWVVHRDIKPSNVLILLNRFYGIVKIGLFQIVYQRTLA